MDQTIQPSNQLHFLRGKTKKKWWTHGQYSRTRGLSFEVAASSDEEINDHVKIPRGAHVDYALPTGVTHLPYQRLVTLQREDRVTEVSRQLWQGGLFCA